MRVVAGALLATSIALAARRVDSLSTSGAWAAAVVGTVAVAAGWDWGILLIAFFVASTVLTRLGADAKASRTASVVEKGGRRDGWQVVCNGGLFAIAALFWVVGPNPMWRAIGAGALAASTADTWGTEIGTLIGGVPRSVLTGAAVPAGTSGAVTIVGSLATIAGALFLGTLVFLAGWSRPVAIAALVGGVAGAFADSLLGATVQERRRCTQCGARTERRRHSCGGATVVIGGLRGFGNDLVNASSTLVGALVSATVFG